MQNISGIYPDYVRRLRAAGVFSPESTAVKILSHVCATQGDEAFCFDRELTDTELNTAESYVVRREHREPLVRIFGHATYMGVDIEIRDDVFRPCFETEALIEHIVEHAELHGRPQKILDLGTGTGCLLLALLRVFPDAVGHGTDINPAAVELAEHNARSNGLDNRASFSVRNWGENLEEKYDLVISHPPSVSSQFIERLEPEMKDYEPRLALDGGEDGLAFFHYIVHDMPRLLSRNGFGVFMIYSQSREARILHKKGFAVELKKNFRGDYCCVFANIPSLGRKKMFGFSKRVAGLFSQRLYLKKLQLVFCRRRGRSRSI